MSPSLKTLILLLVACGLAAPVTRADTSVQPVRLTMATVHQPLYDIAFDGARGVAVGAGGRVLVSSDSGASWSAEKPVSKASLLGVAMRGGHSIAVGQAGLVLIRNGDGDWRTIKVDTSERLMGIDMNSEGLAVVVGSFGTILKSTDFGETWVKTGPDWAPMFADHADTLGPTFAPHLYGVNVSEKGEILIAGELSLILASTGAAKDWHLVSRGNITKGQADPSLFGIRLGDDGSGYAVGQSGRVFKTTDRGVSWTRLDAGTDAILLAAEIGKAGKVLVTGIRDLRISEDGGQHWQVVTSPEIANDWFVAAAPAGTGGGVLVVGSSGKIVRVQD